MEKSFTYAGAGVDIDKGDRFISAIKPLVNATKTPGVMGEIGGFGGLFSLNTETMRHPVLVGSTDGVGTKLKIAFLTGRHDTVGMDLVAMCVNDILVQGAKPLFFLDYLSMGVLDEQIARQVIKGVADGCVEAGCALIGGETAEMPGFYPAGEYDLVGFVVGIVDNERIIDGSEVRVGDKIVGIGSSGIHSNGFSLARKLCFEVLGLKTDDHVPQLGKTMGEELLTPTRIYAKCIKTLIRDFPICALAHITGGGIPGNLVRVLPESCGAKIFRGSWEVPPVFPFLQKAGNVSGKEMMRTFNNGIGMIAVAKEEHAQDIKERLLAMNEKAWIIGEVVERKAGSDQIIWV